MTEAATSDIHPERVARLERTSDRHDRELSDHDKLIAVQGEQISGVREDVAGVLSVVDGLRRALVGAAISFAVGSTAASVTIYQVFG